MKRIQLAALLCFFSAAAFAQQKVSAMQDVLYLKSGSIMRGTIVSTESCKTITLREADGNVLEFPKDDIEKVTQEQALNEDEIEREYLKEQRTAGFDNLTRVGLMFGDTPGSSTLFSASTTFGLVQSSKWVGLGVGAGYDHYQHGDFFPLFADLRVEIPVPYVKPYLFTDAGYTIGIVKGINDPAGGLMVNAGAGARVYVGTKTAVHLEASYKQQAAKEKTLQDASGTAHYNDVTYKFFMVGLGFSF